MDEMLTALETLTTPEATQYLDLIASPIDPALKETLVYLRLPNTPALVVKGLYDGHASQLASLTSQAKYQEKVEAQITVGSERSSGGARRRRTGKLRGIWWEELWLSSRKN